MKKVLLFICYLFLLPVFLSAQTTVLILSENFNSGNFTFSLDTTGVGTPAGTNQWIVNNNYDGQGTYPNTISQDSTVSGTISGAPFSKYMHIYDSNLPAIANANYDATAASDRFAAMKDSICTVGMTGVTFSFFYLCEGNANAYGEVYYSKSSGPWIKVGQAQYNSMSKWKYEVITDPAFDNAPNLRLGFRWVNAGGSPPSNTSFSVDEILMIGTYDNVNNPVSITVGNLPTTVCRGSTMFFSYSISDTLCGGSYSIELSNASGSFLPPQATWTSNLYYPMTTTFVGIIFPSTLPVGTCYKIRVKRISPSPQITGVASICFTVIDCGNTITTLQPSVTKDTNAVCIGSAMDVPFWSTGVFNSGNIYTAQLSDSNGNFSSPQTIGTLPTSASYDPSQVPSPGQVTGLVPTVPEGCGYYVRVVSSNPAFTGTTWGPFCIRQCDIKTNNELDIHVCITPTQGDTIVIPVDINVWNQLATYNSGNQYEAEVLDAGSFAQVNLGGLGIVAGTDSTTMDIIIPPLPGLFALGMQPKLWYLRIIATNSTQPDNVLGTIIRLTIGSPDVNPLQIIPAPGLSTWDDTVLCVGSPVFLTVANSNSSSSYHWFIDGAPFPPSGPVNPLGVFWNSINTSIITVQEENFGCFGTISPPQTIYVIGIPLTGISGPISPCVGDTVVYQVPFLTETYFDWTLSDTTGLIVDTGNNVIKIFFIAVDTLVLTVHGINMCGSNTGTKQIKVKPLPNVNILTNDTSVCKNDSLLLVGKSTTLQVTYAWNDIDTVIASNDSVIVFPDSSTYYIFTVKSIYNCKARDTVNVSVFPPEPTNILINDTSICKNSNLQLLGSTAAPTYFWSNQNVVIANNTQSITVSPVSATYYVFSSVSIHNCKNNDTVNVGVDTLPAADVHGDSALCIGDSTVLLASGGGTYQWNTGDTSSSLTLFPPAGTNNYFVIVRNSFLCSDTGLITVIVNNLPNASGGADDTIAAGASAQLNGSGGVTYSWSPSDGLSCTTCPNPSATPDSTLTYSVTVTDAQGCVNKAEVTVVVEKTKFIVPDIITPNGDGLNDKFYFQEVNIAEIDGKIFNRWGELIFQWNNMNTFWEGKNMKGNPVPDGVYFYIIHAKDKLGKPYEQTGTVTLVR